MFSSYGYWVWTGQFHPLPELDGIPLTNFVGWFVLVMLMLSIYFSLSKSGLTQTKNALDFQLAYLLLIVDGTIELVSQILFRHDHRSFFMLVFLAISYYGGKRQHEIESPNQVMQ